MSRRHLNINIRYIIACYIVVPCNTTIITCRNLQITSQTTHKEFQLTIVQLNNRRFCILSVVIVHVA